MQETAGILRKLLYQISVFQSNVTKPDCNLQNAIAFKTKDKVQGFAGKEYIYNSPAYSLLFSIINRLLLEKVMLEIYK
ncbi:hypothetical protein [Chryseobacterium taichungense]|uniref:hypothetical protein n=1 Tax=Chryseobacterium taichungense TaxID=295069 RepID=UPI000B7EB8EB|nr:hypothetical protein [Chryseobacterium taichungense]